MKARSSMRTGHTLIVLLATVAGAVGIALVPRVDAADAVMSLKWDQLVPPAPPKPPRSFLADRPTDPSSLAAPGHGAASAGPLVEGRWMSGPAKSSGKPPAVVASLDGKRVEIGGYVVPLDDRKSTRLNSSHVAISYAVFCLKK